MQDYMVNVTAESRETGEKKLFSSTLFNVGEMLNELIMSGYHNITHATLTDIP